MRKIRFAACVILVAGAYTASGAQLSSPASSANVTQRANAITALLVFRQVAFFGDTTKLDGCSVFNFLRRTANYLDSIPERLHTSISRTDAQTCASEPDYSDRTPRLIVKSIELKSKRVLLEAVAIAGEYTHAESYSGIPVRSRNGETWAFTDVRLHDFMQALK